MEEDGEGTEGGHKRWKKCELQQKRGIFEDVDSGESTPKSFVQGDRGADDGAGVVPGAKQGGDFGISAAQSGATIRHNNDHWTIKAPHTAGTTSAQWKGGSVRLVVSLAEDGMHNMLMDVQLQMACTICWRKWTP